MKYYVVDNQGNVCGEADTYERADAIMHDAYTEEEIAASEMEVICDNDEE